MIVLAVVFAVVTNQGDPSLVGTWGLSGQLFVTFQADGTGTMDGDPFRWKAKGGTLTLRADGETERAAYQLAADQLVLNLGGMPLSLQRLGRGPKAATPAAASVPDRERAPAPKQAVAGSKQDKQLAALLSRNAWCSFSFKGGSTYSGGSWGSTRSSRVMFASDGTVSRTTGGETTNSGANGTYAGAGAGGEQGYWKIQGGQLYLSADRQSWQLQPVKATTNSSGSPILESDGVEYMVCQ